MYSPQSHACVVSDAISRGISSDQWPLEQALKARNTKQITRGSQVQANLKQDTIVRSVVKKRSLLQLLEIVLLHDGSLFQTQRFPHGHQVHKYGRSQPRCGWEVNGIHDS